MANYQCFICKCTEKHLKKVPFGTLSTLTICYSLFCQSATPEVLALSCLIAIRFVLKIRAVRFFWQTALNFLSDGSDNLIDRLRCNVRCCVASVCWVSLASNLRTYPMFVPLGKTVHTPWQKGLLLTDSAKGIRIDYMLVMHIGKRWRSPFSRVL